MSDALTRLLRRFTPEGAGLDRDALMYEAGRASVPSPARWKALAALLALGQALTLLLVAQPAQRPAPPAEVRPEPAISPASAPPAGAWTMWQQQLQGEGALAPMTVDADLVPDEPPLRVYTAWTAPPVD
jgi:hypothetical protein